MSQQVAGWSLIGSLTTKAKVTGRKSGRVCIAWAFLSHEVVTITSYDTSAIDSFQFPDRDIDSSRWPPTRVPRTTTSRKPSIPWPCSCFQFCRGTYHDARMRLDLLQ